MSWKVNIGELDRALTLQENTRSRTSSGAVSNSWSNAGTIWAKKVVESSMEEYEDDEKTLVDKASFVVRYQTLDAALNRLVDGSITYEIIGIMEEPLDGTFSRNRFLRVKCRARS